MDYMFQTGFLGTKAPFFMDMVTLIVAVLPLLVYGGMLLARNKLYKLHAYVQNIIYVVSVVVVGYFEYGARVSGGFDIFMKESDISYSYALVVLIVHIIIATMTLLHWSKIIIMGNLEYKKEILPGKASKAHKQLAVKTFTGIIFTSFSGIWVYLLMFVY
jgi:putative membrane protein